MPSTEKISLSVDSGALVLARRAASIDGVSLSAWLSRLILTHAWDAERPSLPADEQAQRDAQTAADDDAEISTWQDSQQRRAAG